MTTTPEKDNIYIDVDDEITAIIDKMQASQAKIVALVLPKRAVVLQSIVNMKLLKRAADSAKKNLVLITSDPNLLPLAGAANVYVAKNLQSKPEVPPPPSLPGEDEELSADVPEEKGDEIDTSKPVGELATKNSVAPPPEETIEVDNSTPAAAGAKASKAAKKKAKDKKNRIPNFEQFRKRLFLISGAVVILLIFWFMAVFTLPKAKITIKTDTTNQNAEVNLVASPSATAVDENTDTLPAKAAEQAKADVQKAPATGQKDVGTKATGTITVKNCEDSSSRSLGAGTVFSAGGRNFLSNAGATVPAGKFSNGGTKCNSDSVSVAVTAAENGDSYNLAATSYTSPSLAGTFTITGSAMSGGTSRIAKVVAQADVDSAKAKFTNTDDAAKQALKKSLEDQGYFAITDTFTIKDPQVTASPNVGEEGAEVTVTSKGTYSMLGVKEDDLKTLITASVESEIDTDKQQVQDFGLANAIFKVTKTEANGNVFLSLDTQVAIGPKLDQDQIKQQIAGKKRGDTESIIKETPGVKEVKVSYSPFWVTKTPKKAAKITISVEKVN